MVSAPVSQRSQEELCGGSCTTQQGDDRTDSTSQVVAVSVGRKTGAELGQVAPARQSDPHPACLHYVAAVSVCSAALPKVLFQNHKLQDPECWCVSSGGTLRCCRMERSVWGLECASPLPHTPLITGTVTGYHFFSRHFLQRSFIACALKLWVLSQPT